MSVCNHPTGCREPSAHPWGGFCAMHRAQAEAIISKHADLLRRGKTKPARRPMDESPAPSLPATELVRRHRASLKSPKSLPPTTRRCVVETVLAMCGGGRRPCHIDDLVLVAWARWPRLFSVSGAGTPSDHKARVALAKVGEWVERVGLGLYAPRPGAAWYAGTHPPERKVVDADAARVLLRGP